MEADLKYALKQVAPVPTAPITIAFLDRASARRLRHRRIAIGAVAAMILVVGAITVSRSLDQSPPTRVATLPGSTTASSPTTAGQAPVGPHIELVDVTRNRHGTYVVRAGDVVKVRGRGYPAGARVSVGQCAGDMDCGADAITTKVTAAADGSFTASVTIVSGYSWTIRDTTITRLCTRERCTIGTYSAQDTKTPDAFSSSVAIAVESIASNSVKHLPS